MNIKPGTLCVIFDPAQAEHGRVVTAVRYIGALVTATGIVPDAWVIEAPWIKANEWEYGLPAYAARNLRPISDPDMDCTEADDALLDALRYTREGA